MLFVLVCYILSGLHLMSYVACLLGWDLSIIPKRSKAVIWKAKLAWAMAKTFEGDHRGPFIKKRQFSYSLHRAKRDWYCFGISRLSIQTRSGSAGCKFAEAFKATRRGGPLRMSELCSMCRKMATVQGLESFIFWESLEDNCFMHFTEVLADWFHLHRVRAVTDAGDNCVGRRRGRKYWSISAFPGILLSIVVLAPSDGTAVIDNHMVSPGPFPHVSVMNATFVSFLIGRNQKPKVECLVLLSFQKLNLFPVV